MFFSAPAHAKRKCTFGITAALLLGGLLSASASAALIGTTPVAPGSTVTPGLIPPATSPGTLLATLTSPFSFTTTAGTTTGFVVSAVYREASTTLDFYYQITNSAQSATSIDRNTDVNFAAFFTALGYRTDGSSLPSVLFFDGIEPPVTGDRNAAGSVIGFNFDPPDAARVVPGSRSTLLVISTDAADFTAGNASIIDGGTETVAAFQPTGNPTGIGSPEPATLLLLTAGALGLVAPRRSRR